MNKPIIIDGVDVSECKDYDNGECVCPDTTVMSCEAEPNCYHKQLQRLKAENEELKKVKEQLKKWNDENLKRQDDMQLWIDLAEEQRRNYRSALEEVREIAEKACKKCKNDEFDEDYCIGSEFCALAEINEVLENV